MIETLSRSSGKVFGMRVSGKLLHQDYELFVPALEKLIEKHGSIRCLVEMIDLHGIELRALWDEIKFDVRHARQIERCAVVGDKAWEAWMPDCRGRSSSTPRSASSTKPSLRRRGNGSRKDSRQRRELSKDCGPRL